MPVGDQYTLKDPFVASRGGDPPSGGTDRPVGLDRGDREDLGVEVDQVIVAVVACIGFDVRADLIAPRKVRVIGRHRKAFEEGHIARGDQVQRLVVGVPVPADPIGLLEALDVVTRLAHLLECGHTRCTGADDTVTRHAIWPFFSIDLWHPLVRRLVDT